MGVSVASGGTGKGRGLQRTRIDFQLMSSLPLSMLVTREKIGHFTLEAPLVEKLVRFFLNRVRFFGMNPPGYLMEDPSLSRGRLMTMFLSISSRVAGVGTGEGKNANWVKMFRDGEERWDVGQKPKSKVV